MISRVAESCFWQHRYLERVENTARLLQVNATFLLDANLPLFDHWRPTIVVAGEETRFRTFMGEEALDDAEAVQAYLVWDERCPVSMVNSLRMARENARTIRETISLETWTTINGFWLWLTGGPGRRLYTRDRDAFYERVKDSCHLFHGVCHDTMLHDEPFDFMRLGMHLERADQTARILDLKYHHLGPTDPEEETPAEAAQWLAILRSCSATEPFFKRGGVTPTGPAVAEFLLLEPAFPLAVHHSFLRARHLLRRIRPREQPQIGAESAARLQGMVRRLRSRTIERILDAGIHTELSTVIERAVRVGDAIRSDFFRPTPDPAAKRPASS